MPIYEFRCNACEGVFEVTRPMSKAGNPAKCTAASCAQPKRRPKGGGVGKRLFSASIVGVGGADFDMDFGGEGDMDMGDMDMGGMPGMPGMPGMGGHGHSH